MDTKGKAIKVPKGKPQEKRKKSKPLVEESSKKAKLLSSTMSAARTTKVNLVLRFT